MAIQDRATLYLQFENNDVPTQSGFQNLIDSALNLAATSRQDMAGALSTTELVAPTVSAALINATNITMGAPPIWSASIVSAAGTVQASAASLTSPFNRLQGINNGAATGFIIPSSQSGSVRYAYNETAVSGNLYPQTGGSINGLSTNTPFPLAATTVYTIVAITSSTWAVG